MKSFDKNTKNRLTNFLLYVYLCFLFFLIIFHLLTFVYEKNLQGTITDYALLESASTLLSKSFDKSLEISVEKARSCLADVKLVSSPLSDASRSSYEDSRRLSGHSSDLSSISSPITQISTELKDKKGGGRKRTLIPKETKDFLESLFEKKRSPNSRERKAIADKCGLTPVQVRVWVRFSFFFSVFISD